MTFEGDPTSRDSGFGYDAFGSMSAGWGDTAGTGYGGYGFDGGPSAVESGWGGTDLDKEHPDTLRKAWENFKKGFTIGLVLNPQLALPSGIMAAGLTLGGVKAGPVDPKTMTDSESLAFGDTSDRPGDGLPVFGPPAAAAAQAAADIIEEAKPEKKKTPAPAPAPAPESAAVAAAEEERRNARKRVGISAMRVTDPWAMMFDQPEIFRPGVFV